MRLAEEILSEAGILSSVPLRLRVRVRGAVQGVGFRPFVHALASKLSLSGFVRNDAEGVLLEIEGSRTADFLDTLQVSPPPLARVDSIDVVSILLQGDMGFDVLESESGRVSTRVVPDAAVCEACLDEMFDPASRFYLYPFLSCTHCGPRYTITRALPYDRAQTSMAGFGMCVHCARDYRDPSNRRFHAEPIACAECGPRLSHDIESIVSALQSGAIVALKGIGGFHLLCDARKESAVKALRDRKARDAKPFAVMMANVASVEQIADVEPLEKHLLQTSARPAVVMRSKGKLASSVAPNLGKLGVMLPYAPLHHLLFHAAAGSPAQYDRDAVNPLVLVATSANPGGEPLVVDDEDAQRRLRTIADVIVTHDRPILIRSDDSVVTVMDGAPAFLRRARGYVPEPIDLGEDGPCVLAMGGHLKATVTVTRGREAFVSQHVGDLDRMETIRFYDETIRHQLSILDVRPDIVACDLHPDYLSTRLAEERDLPLIKVQHHAAHIAAVAAEHREAKRGLGVALDGHGYGPDGAAWGGELLQFDGLMYDMDSARLGCLKPLPMPGGDRAAREPWRMGIAALASLGESHRSADFFPDVPFAGNVAAALEKQSMHPMTTSMGRLFDAAASLAGICLFQHYEGQAAMEFEALVSKPQALPGGFRLDDNGVDFRGVLRWIVMNRPSKQEAAEYFHGTLIEGLSGWIEKASMARNQRQVFLGGGCFLNRVLAEGLAASLRGRGLQPLLPRVVPANDGGLSLGQAAIARARLMHSASDDRSY